MVCLGSVGAAGKQGEGESEEVKWGSLMMTRLDVARQTVSSCLCQELYLIHTHMCTHKPTQYHMHTHINHIHRVKEHAQGHPSSSLLRNYLLFQGLKLQEQLISLTPCRPQRLSWESEPECIHTGDSTTPRAALWMLPATPSTHTHTHTYSHWSSKSSG